MDNTLSIGHPNTMDQLLWNKTRSFNVFVCIRNLFGFDNTKIKMASVVLVMMVVFESENSNLFFVFWLQISRSGHTHIDISKIQVEIDLDIELKHQLTDKKFFSEPNERTKPKMFCVFIVVCQWIWTKFEKEKKRNNRVLKLIQFYLRLCVCVCVDRWSKNKNWIPYEMNI